MWSRNMTPAEGIRLLNQLASLSVALAFGEISLNSAMMPVDQLRTGADCVQTSPVPQKSHPFLSSPMSKRLSERYMCGGTSRLSGAGLFLNTRPAKSNVEPWQGHRKPPRQSSGSEGWAPGWNLSEGEQPRCVQMPTPTQTSGLMERNSFLA